ncbi:MAG: DUF1573 domain-containing protein [Planctomycetaceae bacterium]
MRKSPVRACCVAMITLVTLTGVASAQELNWAQKLFSQQEHDFGVVARGADVRHRILVKNIYKEPITISEVKTTCGCTAASPSAKFLKTNEEAYIEVQMNTVKFMRQKDSNVDVTVTFDNLNYKTVRIPIHAYIRTDVVLTPGGANFGNVDLGVGSQRTINVAYAGRDDWKVREVRTNSEYVKAAVRETSRAGGKVNYELTVAVDEKAPEGTINEIITLVTDDANNPFVPVEVVGVVESDIVVATPMVALGDMQAGVEKTVRVVVRGRKPFTIENIECESERECFKVLLSQEEKTVHVLPITVVPPAESGAFKEAFTVHIAGRPQPVTFKAEGNIQ